MIKYFTIISTLMLFGFSSTFAQQNVSVLKSNSNRLNIDFEVKDTKNPDARALSSINLDHYEAFRQSDLRVQVTDTSTGYTLILYSQKETDMNRAKQSPVQKNQKLINQYHKSDN